MSIASVPIGRSFALRVCVLLNGGLFLMFVVFWLKMATQDIFWRADFTAFYTGWSMVLDGQGSHLYDLEVQAIYQQRALPDPQLYEGLLPFANPPHSALLFAPLALLPRGTAFTAWAILQIGLCILAWRLIEQLTRTWAAPSRQILLITLLGFPPLFMSFQQGQLALFGLVCLLGFVKGLKEGRPVPTAFWLILGTVKPQLMVIPAVILLACRRWRKLAIATVLFLTWAGLTAWALGPESWWSYPRYLQFSSRQFGTSGIDPLRMYNLKGLLTGLLHPEHAGLINALTTVGLLLNVVAVLWLWRGPRASSARKAERVGALHRRAERDTAAERVGALHRRAERDTAAERVGAAHRRAERDDKEAHVQPDFDLRLGYTFLLAAVCNPHFNPTDALVLVVPAILVFGSLDRCSPLRTPLGGILVFCPLLFLIDVYTHPWPGAIRPFFVLMLGACVWLAWLRTWNRGTDDGNVWLMTGTSAVSG